MIQKRLIIPLFLAAALLAIYLALNFRNDTKIIDLQKPLMGSMVQIKAPVDERQDEGMVGGAIRKAFEEIERIERIFSTYKEDSDISRINRLKPDEALKVQDEVFDLIEESIEFNKKTRGAFDITVKPLVDLWNGAKTKNVIPTDEQIKNALARIGSQDIILDRVHSTISFKKEGMALDMGGIAQGYATDRAIRILKENGIEDAIVNLGGDMYCLGRKSKADLWKVGIQHPRKKNELYLEIKLEDKAINTSGDYEKYFMLNGKRYSHIIDPRTGYPIGDKTVSATIIAADCTSADALATALCVLGQEGMDIINSMKDVDAILIFKEGDRLKMEMSEGVKTRYGLSEKK
ncbi:MAG: FAD:protein FMN transferase [Candidatus Omnitrophica bacterium]|nr:FAD:protein FMN transferase [Candidatus Omnitrophota bacterium]